MTTIPTAEGWENIRLHGLEKRRKREEKKAMASRTAETKNVPLEPGVNYGELKSPTPATLLQRLAAVQGKVDYIQKEKKQGMRYSIVSHDAVTAKVRPLMVEHGVLYYPVWMEMGQVGNRTELKLTVRFVNVDDADDFIDVVTAGYGIDDQDKGPGKAISYAVKYALLKTLGLESGDDPDEDQTTTHSNPGDPHNIAMAEFEGLIDLAADIAGLERAAALYKARVEQAAAIYPARVQLARQRYAQKLKALKA